jgi:hypothetical protein
LSLARRCRCYGGRPSKIFTDVSAPSFEETPIVTIKQGGTTKAAIGGIIEKINNIINYNLFVIIK